VAPADALALVEELHAQGVEDAAIIGEVVDSPKERILVSQKQEQ